MDDRTTQRNRELRQATACGALSGAMVGTLIGIPSALWAWIADGNRAAGLSFVAVWATWVIVGALVCRIGAVFGGMRLRTLLRWGAGLGAVAGLLTAISLPSPLGAIEAVLLHGAAGVAFALVVSYLWWHHLAGR